MSIDPTIKVTKKRLTSIHGHKTTKKHILHHDMSYDLAHLRIPWNYVAHDSVHYIHLHDLALLSTL